MNIIYRKNTLYVYLQESITDDLVSRVEDRVNNIMNTYEIENLVIDTNGQERNFFNEFETRYNTHHRSRVIIK